LQKAFALQSSLDLACCVHASVNIVYLF
jgi:hypothetical protein